LRTTKTSRHVIIHPIAKELFKDQHDYISKVAETGQDACAIVDAGFEFVCDFNGAKIFRTRKY
jgi:hypothetical protein